MNIVFSSDNNYTQHLGVALCSLFENNLDEMISIYVIDGGINEENKKKLRLLEERYNFKINYIKPNRELFKYTSTRSYATDVEYEYITEAAYYRLSIGELLPLSVDRVIYLDCDIVIISRIQELWNNNLDENILSAVIDRGINKSSHLGIDKDDYFNTGVLLIDLTKWRKQNIGQKCLEFIEKKNRDASIFWDQDILNKVLCGKWKKMDLKFNYMFNKVPFILIFTKNERQKKEFLPTIIHYYSYIKPWHFFCDHPYKNEYYKYLGMTPWKDFNPTLPTFKHILKYYYYNFINYDAKYFMRHNVLNKLGIQKSFLK